MAPGLWFKFSEKVSEDKWGHASFSPICISPKIQIYLGGLHRSLWLSVLSGCCLKNMGKQENGKQMEKEGFLSSASFAWCWGARRAKAVWGDWDLHWALLSASLDQTLSCSEAERNLKNYRASEGSDHKTSLPWWTDGFTCKRGFCSLHFVAWMATNLKGKEKFEHHPLVSWGCMTHNQFFADL